MQEKYIKNRVYTILDEMLQNQAGGELVKKRGGVSIGGDYSSFGTQGFRRGFGDGYAVGGYNIGGKQRRRVKKADAVKRARNNQWIQFYKFFQSSTGSSGKESMKDASVEWKKIKKSGLNWRMYVKKYY